jgi:hypothetical protein
MAMDVVVQRLQVGDVISDDFPEHGGGVEATVEVRCRARSSLRKDAAIASRRGRQPLGARTIRIG